MHLLTLLPGKRYDQRLVDEFNRRMDLEYERIRDFLILHYHLNSRNDAELWRYCRAMEVPESLQRKIALFSHSGIVEQYKDGLFTPPSWLSVYLGQGLTPQHFSPLAEAIPVNRLLKELDDLREDIRDRIDELPKHSSFIARYANAQQASDMLLHEAEGRV